MSIIVQNGVFVAKVKNTKRIHLPFVTGVQHQMVIISYRDLFLVFDLLCKSLKQICTRSCEFQLMYKMQAKTAGTIAINKKGPAHGVEMMGCAVLQNQDGQTTATDVMESLEEKPSMSAPSKVLFDDKT